MSHPPGKCAQCGESFDANAVGRPRRYCSNACRQQALRDREKGHAQAHKHLMRLARGT